MTPKERKIAEATDLGIELDGNETIADLDAKITAHNAETTPTEGMTCGQAIDALANGSRVMRESWADNAHFDPAHIRGGIRLAPADIGARDWRII